MKVGDLVQVSTKFYGDKAGIIIEEVTDDRGTSFLVQPFDHPNRIMSEPQDMSMIVQGK